MTDKPQGAMNTDRELLEEALGGLRRLEAGRYRLEIAVWILIALSVLSFACIATFGTIAAQALLKTTELAEALDAP